MSTVYRSQAGEQAIQTKYNELLRHWPVERETQHIETSQGITHVMMCGDQHNPPLVLLHDSAQSSIRWISDIESLSKSHRVYVIDVIGEPNQSQALRPKIKASSYVQWLDEVLSDLNLNRIAIIGEGFGAWIALSLSCASPEKVIQLALLNPAGIVRTRKRFKIKALFAVLLGGFGQKMLMRHIAKGAHLDTKTRDYHSLVKKYFKPRRRKYPLFANKALSQLYCPILLIVGKKSVLFSADKILRRLARCVTSLEVIYRNNDGHWLSTCTREIDRFLVTQYPLE